MADTIGTYYFQLAPTTEGLSNSISKALGGVGEEGGKSFSSGFGKVIGTAGAVVGGVSAAIGGISSALINATNDAASYADEVDKMSQKMGISAEAYQEWDAVMQHSGTSMESLKSSIKTMANAALTGNEAFQALGISEEEVANLSQEDLFARVISGLQDMGESTERTYLASQLLGRGATELGALLNTSAEDTQAMKDRVHELNGVLSDESIKAGAAFQDQLQDMQTASQGLVRTMSAEFLPGITEVMGGLTDVFTGDTETGAEKIAQGISDTLDKVTGKLDTVMNIGSTIVLTLANSIVSNLPSVVKTGMMVLEKLLLGITSMLPDIVTMASTVIVEIASGLADSAPVLIPAVMSAVMSTLQTLIDNLPMISGAVLDLVSAIADSFLNDGLPILISTLPDIISGIIKFVLASTGQFISAVAMLVQSIGEALPSVINTLIPMIPELVLEIINALISCGPELGVAAIELFSVLITILPQIIGEIWKEVPKVGMAIIEVFKSKIPELKETAKQSAFAFLKSMSGSEVFARIRETLKSIGEGFKNNFITLKNSFVTWGKNLIDGLIEGIKNKISAVTDTVKEVSTKVADGFKDFFGIHSPSTLFRSYGQYLDEGLAEGIVDSRSIVDDAMGALDTSVSDIEVSALYDSGYNTRAAAPQTDSGLYDLLAQYLPYLAQENNVNVSLEGNANGLFDLVKKANSEYKKQTGKSAFA